MAENLNLAKYSRMPFVNRDGTLTKEAQMSMAVVQRRTGDIAGNVYADTIIFLPAGNIAAGDLQAAVEELDAEKQPIDATLTAVAGVTTAADKLIYWTGVDAAALADFPSFGRTLVANTVASGARSDLGLGTIATQSASNVAITGGAIDGTTVGFTTQSSGQFTFVVASYVRTTSVPVISLPAAASAGEGARAFVNDSTQTLAAGIGSAVAGGGANKVPVHSDGASWLIG